MADSPAPKKAAKKSSSKQQAPEQPPPPFKPGKVTTYDRQVVDYVRCATAKNIWYYR